MASNTAITETDLSGAYDGSLDSVTFEAADTSNNNEFTVRKDKILLARNTASTGSSDITLTSTDDGRNRQEDISSYTISAGEVHAIYFQDVEGWVDSDGDIAFSATSTDIEFAVLNINPANFT